MSEFGLKKSFNIDNGELAEFSPQQCFLLGYELAEIDSLLTLDAAFGKPVHSFNAERIQKTCRDADRLFTLELMSGDASESWMWLEVSEK